MLFFADSGEGAITQAVLMGSVAAVVVSMLFLIQFLDSPFQDGVGGVRPVAMERSLRIVDEATSGRGRTRAAALRRTGEPDFVRAGLGRGRRDGSARLRGRRNGVEQLSGHALER